MGGGFGVRIDPAQAPVGEAIERTDVVLFSESPSRFLLEVAPDTDLQLDVPHAAIGEVIAEPQLDYGAFQLSLDEAREAFFVWEHKL